MNTSPHHARTLPVLALLLLMAGTPVSAQNDRPFNPRIEPPTLPSPSELARTPVDPGVLALVQALAAESYEDREEGMKGLIEKTYDHRQLYAVMARYPLDEEQRHRLVEVIRHRLLAAPKGAVGISMRPRRGNGPFLEVEVVEVIPGLPAEHVLQVQDRIFEIDGRPLVAESDLVDRVQIREPGDTISVAVRRPEISEDGGIKRDAEDRPLFTTLRFELTLGSLDQLRVPGRNSTIRKSQRVMQRELEAKDAVRHFGPEPGRVQVREGLHGIFVPTTDVATK